MYTAERREGDHQIYAVARKTPRGGFLAGCVVRRTASTQRAAEEIFRDVSLEDGRVWNHPEQALDFALEVGVAAVHAQALLAETGREQAVTPVGGGSGRCGSALA